MRIAPLRVRLGVAAATASAMIALFPPSQGCSSDTCDLDHEVAKGPDWDCERDNKLCDAATRKCVAKVACTTNTECTDGFQCAISLGGRWCERSCTSTPVPGRFPDECAGGFACQPDYTCRPVRDAGAKD
jgi:hypothetical protein